MNEFDEKARTWDDKPVRVERADCLAQLVLIAAVGARLVVRQLSAGRLQFVKDLGHRNHEAVAGEQRGLTVACRSFVVDDHDAEGIHAVCSSDEAGGRWMRIETCSPAVDSSNRCESG